VGEQEIEGRSGGQEKRKPGRILNRETRRSGEERPGRILNTGRSGGQEKRIPGDFQQGDLLRIAVWMIFSFDLLISCPPC
jgi:hypothetical protein